MFIELVSFFVLFSFSLNALKKRHFKLFFLLGKVIKSSRDRITASFPFFFSVLVAILNRKLPFPPAAATASRERRALLGTRGGVSRKTKQRAWKPGRKSGNNNNSNQQYKKGVTRTKRKKKERLREVAIEESLRPIGMAWHHKAATRQYASAITTYNSIVLSAVLNLPSPQLTEAYEQLMNVCGNGFMFTRLHNTTSQWNRESVPRYVSEATKENEQWSEQCESTKKWMNSRR